MTREAIPDNPPDGMQVTRFRRNNEYGVIEFRYTYHKHTPAMEILDEWYRDRNPKDFIDEWWIQERRYDVGKDSDLTPREWRGSGRTSTKILQETTGDAHEWHPTFADAVRELRDWLLARMQYHEREAASTRDKFEWVLKEWS